MTNTRK